MSQPELSGKVLVIIGGTTGLGLSAARVFVQEGARVVVVGRKAENVRAVETELQDAVRAFAGDGSDPATGMRAVAMAIEEFGAFHGLYHVAGGSGRSFGDGPLHEITDEGWER